MHYVYKVVNLVSEAIYVGKSVDPHRRWKGHQYAALHKNMNWYFHHAIRKYGAESFRLDIINEFEIEADSFAAERTLIIELRESGHELYNMTSGGKGPLGYRHSADALRRIGEASTKSKLGKPGHIPNEETRQRMSDAQKKLRESVPNPMQGKTHSDESKEKMRISHLGRGRPHSQETRDKIRASMLKKKLSV